MRRPRRCLKAAAFVTCNFFRVIHNSVFAAERERSFAVKLSRRDSADARETTNSDCRANSRARAVSFCFMNCVLTCSSVHSRLVNQDGRCSPRPDPNGSGMTATARAISSLPDSDFTQSLYASQWSRREVAQESIILEQANNNVVCWSVLTRR